MPSATTVMPRASLSDFDRPSDALAARAVYELSVMNDRSILIRRR